MNKLSFVFIGFLLAAIILLLLMVLVRKRQGKKALKEAGPEGQDKPIETKVPDSGKESALSSEKSAPIGASPIVMSKTKSLDGVIQSGFNNLKEGAYEQAIKLFQEGLRLTDDSKVSAQLYLEIAKIHNTLSEYDAALKDIDCALELSKANNNGATEKQIMQIRKMISSQKNGENKV